MPDGALQLSFNQLWCARKRGKPNPHIANKDASVPLVKAKMRDFDYFGGVWTKLTEVSNWTLGLQHHLIPTFLPIQSQLMPEELGSVGGEGFISPSSAAMPSCEASS